MNAVEPNLPALLLLSVCWAVSCLAFLTLAGMFPRSARPSAARAPGAGLLIYSNAVLLLVLAAATATSAYLALRWTTLAVAGGLIALFIPAALQAWSSRWRDGRAGLLILFALQSGVMLALVKGTRATLLGPD